MEVTMPIVKLTQDFITNHLQCPAGKTKEQFCCSALPGFLVECRAVSPGRGTYWVRYKGSEGTTKYAKVGKTTEISLADARKKAQEIKAEIKLGADPRAKEDAIKAVISLSEFYCLYFRPISEPRKRSFLTDAQRYETHIKPRLGHFRLNQITRQQIVILHNDLKASGLAAATANHVIKLLRHIYNVAISIDMAESNPASKIKHFPEENKIERYLEKDQLEKLLSVLKTDQNRSVCQIALFLLSTGARLNEALTATWGQVDIPNRVWKILAINSKSKRIRSVPLNDSSIDVLNQIGIKDKNDHVFLSPKGTPYKAIHKSWERLREKAGLPHLRIHDLRHQYASFLVNSGRTLYEVQQILGHSTPNVTTRYAHLSTKSLQDAANSASIIINEAMQMKPKLEIVAV
jgi:site-specific recombinase XerD